MPKNETLMRELVARYGKEKGEAIYWGMAGEGTGPFGPRGKYRGEHEAIAAKGGTTPNAGRKKKPRPAGGKRAGASAKSTRRATRSSRTTHRR